MASNMENWYAVLTGDIVGSSSLAAKDLKRLMQRLRDAADRFEKHFPGSVVGRLDVFGGDGWQLVLKDRARALRAALFLRAVVKSDDVDKPDTRIALAWGPVDVGSLNLDRVSESTGDAFTRSGRVLKNMSKHRRFELAEAPADADPTLVSASVGLLDQLILGWTPIQARSVALALLGLTQLEMADRMGKGQSTINQSLQSAGWQSVSNFVDAVGYRS